MLARTLCALALVATTAAVVTDDRGWDLLATDAGDPVPRTCLPATGMPAWLQGTYFVSGPARWQIGDYKLAGLFDGLGRVNRFELGGGKVCFTANWINTTFSSASLAAGVPKGMLMEETVPPRPDCPLLKPLCEMQVPADNDWVNLVMVGGEPLLLTDAAQMRTLDPKTLESKGFKVWADDKKSLLGLPTPKWVENMHVGTSGSAHPVKRPGTNTVVNIISVLGPVPGQKSYIDVYTFEADKVGPQNRTKIASIANDKAPYMHSFGVTPNYVILPLDQVMGTPDMGHPILLGKIIEDFHGYRIVDKEGKVHIFNVKEKTYHVHIVNSFENATGVTLDVGVYKRSPFSWSPNLDVAAIKNKTARDAATNRAVVRRIHFHMSGPLSGETTTEDFPQIKNSNADFFKMNGNFVGLPYCVYYATQWWHDSTNYASMAIMKHDVCKGTQTYWSKPDVYPGEPYMIPGPSGKEDDGVVAFVALDGKKGKSQWVMLDAETFKELPGGVVELPAHIPFTAHGEFFAGMKLEDEMPIVV